MTSRFLRPATISRRDNLSLKSISDLTHQAIDRMEARLDDEFVYEGVETGFRILDLVTGGLPRGELIVLAARPSMGKTSLAMNIAGHVAVEQSRPVVFLSFENSAIDLTDQLICSRTGVNRYRLRHGTISSEDRNRLIMGAREISESSMFIDDLPSRTTSEISAAARRIKRRKQQLGLVVIDCLQMLVPNERRGHDGDQFAPTMRRLKCLARELAVPVLCLSRLSPSTEHPPNHRPRLSHLRGSGDIEQEADVVLFLHREECYHPGEDRARFDGQAELIVAKQRNGPLGVLDLKWEGDFQRFTDPTLDPRLSGLSVISR